MNTCQNCNQPTKNPKFCSRQCAATVNNSKIPKRIKTKKCIDCQELIKADRKRCTKCNKIFKNSTQRNTIGYYRNLFAEKGTMHKSATYNNVRQLARQYNPKLKDVPCAICGYKFHTEICHIKPLSTFPDSALISDINHPDNLVALCRNCHWELDHIDNDTGIGLFISTMQQQGIKINVEKDFFNEPRYVNHG